MVLGPKWHHVRLLCRPAGSGREMAPLFPASCPRRSRGFELVLLAHDGGSEGLRCRAFHFLRSLVTVDRCRIECVEAPRRGDHTDLGDVVLAGRGFSIIARSIKANPSDTA
jgi:hypothetical protein